MFGTIRSVNGGISYIFIKHPTVWFDINYSCSLVCFTGHSVVAANASIPTKFQTIVTENSDRKGFLAKSKRFRPDANVVSIVYLLLIYLSCLLLSEFCVWILL